jgi:hypothetical protein
VTAPTPRGTPAALTHLRATPLPGTEDAAAVQYTVHFQKLSGASRGVTLSTGFDDHTDVFVVPNNSLEFESALSVTPTTSLLLRSSQADPGDQKVGGSSGKM